jgi:Mg2+ and Co2+ transporter CorA
VLEGETMSMEDMRKKAAKNAMELSQSDKALLKEVIGELKKAVEMHRSQHERLQKILDNSK